MKRYRLWLLLLALLLAAGIFLLARGLWEYKRTLRLPHSQISARLGAPGC